MTVRLSWETQKPSDGLKGAMERIARAWAENGEWHTVQIVSDPKTQSGSKRKPAHFKVKLTGDVEGRVYRAERLINIRHSNGTSYQTKQRPSNYNYATLVASNHDYGTPKIKREQREQEAREQAAKDKQAAGSMPL